MFARACCGRASLCRLALLSLTTILVIHRAGRACLPHVALISQLCRQSYYRQNASRTFIARCGNHSRRSRDRTERRARSNDARQPRRVLDRHFLVTVIIASRFSKPSARVKRNRINVKYVLLAAFIATVFSEPRR